jgi:hypothetical protein
MKHMVVEVLHMKFHQGLPKDSRDAHKKFIYGRSKVALKMNSSERILHIVVILVQQSTVYHVL